MSNDNKITDYVGIITDNQQFSGILPGSILLLILNAIYSNDGVLSMLSNALVSITLIHAFCLTMLTNAYMQKIGYDHKKLLDKYNWMAFVTSILFIISAYVTVLSFLPYLWSIGVHITMLNTAFMYWNFKSALENESRENIPLQN